MIRKVLYKNRYTSPIRYGYKEEHKIEAYFELELIFDLKDGLRFTAKVPNMSCCMRNPFKAMCRVLEHESIGMAKYNRLKQDVDSSKLWNKIEI